MQYHLIIAEDSATRYYGIKFKFPIENREHFRPGDGEQLAHDILEHPLTAHADMVVDELMALGGLNAGRIQHGYIRKYSNRGMSYNDFSADILSLLQSMYYDREIFCSHRCSDTCEDYEQISTAVDTAIEKYKRILHDPELVYFSRDNIIGWVCRGYNLFKERFTSGEDVVRYLFPRIIAVAEAWARKSNLGDEAILNVCYSSLQVWIE